MRSLDRAFYDDFELFLCTDHNLKPKSVHEHLYRLKKLTMRAVSQGTLRRDPYCRLHPELPKRKSRHMKLEDLKTLMTTPVEKPQLQFVRDMFIFSTFTGLAYADLKNCQSMILPGQMTVHGGYIYTGRRQTRFRLSACWIFHSESLKSTAAKGRGIKYSTCTPVDISFH